MPEAAAMSRETVRERLERYAAAVSVNHVPLSERLDDLRRPVDRGLSDAAGRLTDAIAKASGIDPAAFASVRAELDARRRVMDMEGTVRDLHLMGPWTAMVLHERRSADLAEAEARRSSALLRIETDPAREEELAAIRARISEIDAEATPGLASAVGAGYASGGMGGLRRAFQTAKAAVSGYASLLAERTALQSRLVEVEEDAASLRRVAVASRGWKETDESHSSAIASLRVELGTIEVVAAKAIADRDKLASEKWNTPHDCAVWRSRMLDSEIRPHSEASKELRGRMEHMLAGIAVFAGRATPDTVPAVVRLLEPMLGERAPAFVADAMRNTERNRRMDERLKADPLAGDRMDAVRKLRVLLEEGSSSDKDAKAGRLLDRLESTDDKAEMRRIGREAEDEPMVQSMRMC